MAGKTGVTVRIVSNRLPQIAGALSRAAASEVARAAFSIEAQAKGKVPVRTGTLRRSIHSVFENGGLTGIIGPSVNYGAFVEFGTRHMAARPYMRPAAEMVLPTFVARLKATLEAVAGGGSIPSLPSLPATPAAPVMPAKPRRARKKASATKKVKVAKPKHFESSGFKQARRRNSEYERLGRAAERAARRRKR